MLTFFLSNWPGALTSSRQNGWRSNCRVASKLLISPSYKTKTVEDKTSSRPCGIVHWIHPEMSVDFEVLLTWPVRVLDLAIRISTKSREKSSMIKCIVWNLCTVAGVRQRISEIELKHVTTKRRQKSSLWCNHRIRYNISFSFRNAMSILVVELRDKSNQQHRVHTKNLLRSSRQQTENFRNRDETFLKITFLHNEGNFWSSRPCSTVYRMHPKIIIVDFEILLEVSCPNTFL